MPVEIESILQHDDVQIVLEASEASGTVRQSELNDLTEAHEFDVFELDLLYRELETRGIECVDDTREALREAIASDRPELIEVPVAPGMALF